ncbi:MAG: dCTP deaminase [candidate division Zixibacteria bacterium]|nr:dCTP deaminase [candidate division Zixibacteria bacterium]
MSIKSDRWIRNMARTAEMIRPFAPRQIRKGISYGLSSYGYDMRVADEFRILTGVDRQVLDPKHPDPDAFTSVKAKSILIPPHGLALARTVEYFKIPRNILTICVGKSTYARCGLVVNVTPFEPEWEGFATMALSNTAPLPVRVYAGEGIAQLIFLESDEECEISYADKRGKYQAQKTITPAKI